MLHNPQESMLELPRELRQLEQMHRERQEWAADHYPITEQGLLARFNPRTQSRSKTSPGGEEQGQGQPRADTIQPVCIESAQVDLLQRPPTSPLKSTNVSTMQSVDVPTSPHLPAQVSELRKQVFPLSNLSIGVGKGRIEVLMDTVGRGRPIGSEQSTLFSLPAIGRGFLLQMPTAQITQESTGDMKTPGRMEMTPSCPSLTPSQEVMPQPATGAIDLSKDTSSLRGEQSLSSLLRQSFRSFRY